VSVEATLDGSTILSYFFSPYSGRRSQYGNSVNVTGATDKLQVTQINKSNQ
jgi:hypothetical protein